MRPPVTSPGLNSCERFHLKEPSHLSYAQFTHVLNSTHNYALILPFLPRVLLASTLARQRTRTERFGEEGAPAPEMHSCFPGIEGSLVVEMTRRTAACRVFWP